MKRSSLILKIVLAISLVTCTMRLHSQSPYINNPFLNPYDPGNNGFSLSMTDPFDQNSIAGEYLIKADHFEWANFSTSGEFQIAYKIETVSFPFAPDCMGSTCIANQSRNLVSGFGTINQFTLPYNSFANSYGLSLNNQLVLESPILLFRSGQISQTSQLVSIFYSDTLSNYLPIGIPDSSNIYRKINFPHSVLKHTIYLICAQSSNIIDSVSWI